MQHWISVDEALPIPRREVLVATREVIEIGRYCCDVRLAFYVPKYLWAVDLDEVDFMEEWCDLHPEEDEWYYPAGWYEFCAEVDTYNKKGGTVTHWMPVPAPPRNWS